MDHSDQRAIEQLFAKLSEVERQSPPRDQGAEAFIRQQISAQPGAPYYMAQTIIVQQQALEMAKARIAELESLPGDATPQSGGLFSSGGSRSSAPRTGPAAWRSVPPTGQQGGGFLAGAAQAALGVAGGLLLGNAIAGMFSGGEASATEGESGMGEFVEDPGSFDSGDFDTDF